MSFIYSQALVEEFLRGKCSDTEQSAPLSGIHTLKPSLWHDKTMEPSRLFRFGMTCKPLMEHVGGELLTSFVEAFRARTSALPEKAQVLTEGAAGFGGKWRGWLAKYDPATSLWKTAQCSLIEDLTECLQILPRSGMTRDGLLWELPMLERRTNEIGYGFWPTPTVCGNYNRKGLSKTSGDGLATAVKKCPTPQASDNRDRGSLNSPAILRRQEKGKQLMLSQVVSEESGALNPTWVEWLMGWPIGHTDLKR